MGRALVTNVATASDPGATITATAAGAGSSLTISNFASTDSANLVHLSRTGATAGIIRLRSPKLVDNVQGIRYATVGAGNDNLLSLEALQALYAQDTLTLEVTGGAAEYDGGVFTVEYTNLPGGSPTLKMPGDISGITKFVDGIQVNATASATPGAWADTLVNNLYDVFIGNTDYAVLGYVCDAPVSAIALYGTDTSSLRIGGPGLTTPLRTRSYFADLSLKLGRPCIPVFNSANKGNTHVSVADVAASTAVNVTLVCAVLGQQVTGT